MTEAIAIVGAGPVGRALATGLMRAKHGVAVAVRQPDLPKYDDLRLTVDVQSLPDAVARATVIILAVPADTLAILLPTLQLTTEQIVVDATNAVFTPIPDGFDTLGDYVGSLLAPGVALVKAFNTIGAEHLAGGRFDQPTFLPIAGDEAGVDVAAALGSELGFDVAELGGREAFEMVESHARLWIHLAIKRGWGRDIAWSLVRR